MEIYIGKLSKKSWASTFAYSETLTLPTAKRQLDVKLDIKPSCYKTIHFFMPTF